MCIKTYLKWVDKKAKKFKWLDLGMLKWTTAFWVLFLLVAWPGLRDLLLGVAWGWYLALAVLTTGWLFKRMFK